MKREQLEHILRAAAAITGTDRFVIIGSEAIHGSCANPPEMLVRSREADLFSLRSEQDALLVEGSIGELSPFSQAFGVHAHGVGRETATLPAGWEGRLIPLKSPATGGATGLCLEVHDLAVSKLVAGRQKDTEYLAELLRHRLADPETIRQRLNQTTLDPAVRERCLARLSGLPA